MHSPVDCKDVAELVPGVDVRSHAEAKHNGIFTMQHQCPVDDVDEKMNVSRVSEITHHGLEHETHQFHPAELVNKIQSRQFLMYKKKWSPLSNEPFEMS